MLKNKANSKLNIRSLFDRATSSINPSTNKSLSLRKTDFQSKSPRRLNFNLTKSNNKDIEFIPINVQAYKDVKADEELAADEDLNSTRLRFEERVMRAKEYEESLLKKSNKLKVYKDYKTFRY